MRQEKSTKNNRFQNEAGFSLIELLIASVVLLDILGILATIVSGVQSAYRGSRNRVERQMDALASLNLITRVIRNAGNNTTQIPFTATGNNRLQVKSDWVVENNSLSDPFENVDFYVSDNILYMTSVGSSSTTAELAKNIESINFAYFDSNGITTSTMSSVARVQVSITINGESQPLISNVGVRKMIQPK